MKHRLLHIIPLLLSVVLLAACLSESEGPTGLHRGSFVLSLSADSLSVEVTTRAARQLTDQEAADYCVTLTHGDETLWEQKVYSQITEADRTQPVGTGYKVSAENCTAAEAETDNSGWGRKRIWGESEPFEIKVSATPTLVTVPCQMVNAGLCVVFDASFTSRFPEYAVTTGDLRALKFDAARGAVFDSQNRLQQGTIAYYNIGESGNRDIPLVISASAGWDGTVRLTRTLTLQAGRTYRVKVRLGEPEPETGNIAGITITYDDVFTPAGDVEILLE